MRIVSFLPSATETLYELGAGNQIVGVTHECKYPSQARKKPQVIRPSFDPSRMTGRDIDNKIVELMHSREGHLHCRRKHPEKSLS